MDSFEDFEFITLQDVAEATCEQTAATCKPVLTQARAEPAVTADEDQVSNPDQQRKLETGSVSQPALAFNEQRQHSKDSAELLQTLQESKVTVVPICMTLLHRASQAQTPSDLTCWSTIQGTDIH